MKFNDVYKKAMVTGGAGFIGSHIIEYLLNEGVEVICADNYLSGKKENLTPFFNNPNFKEVECDISNKSELEKIFLGSRIDIIFNEAASKKTICLKDPRRDLEINSKGALNIFDLARVYKVKKVVHASTGSVYGELQQSPQDELHPLNPVSYYGVSKLAGEKYARVFEEMYGTNITVLRYFHVYGPRQDCSNVGGVVSIFGRQVLNNEPITIFGDGSQQRSFTSVRDIVAINMHVALSKNSKGQVYNCASGISVTIEELATKIKHALGKSTHPISYDEWTPGDIRIFDIDNRKIKSLGFKFNINFDEGLIETLNWLKTYLST